MIGVTEIYYGTLNSKVIHFFFPALFHPVIKTHPQVILAKAIDDFAKSQKVPRSHAKEVYPILRVFSTHPSAFCPEGPYSRASSDRSPLSTSALKSKLPPPNQRPCIEYP